ncbi:MAG: hypothetical protein ACXAC7_09570 [Candidatus Hodarchaeales archaeon]|jgi:hypothetical protein
MTKDPEEISKELVQLGIRGIFIITRDGLPILVRRYAKTAKFFEEDPTLLSGFLAGLGNFADDQISGLLSDIGLHTIRLFFDYTEHIIFLLAFDEMKLLELPAHMTRTLVKGSMAEIKSSIQEFFSDVDETISEIAENPRLFKRVRESLAEIGPVLDRILYKSHLELLKLIEDPNA